MAVKPLDDILAAMGKDATAAERAERIYYEIEKLGDDAPGVEQYAVVMATMRATQRLLMNVLLDGLQDMGLLPEGKPEALRQLADAVRFVEAYSLYEQMEAAEGE